MRRIGVIQMGILSDGNRYAFKKGGDRMTKIIIGTTPTITYKFKVVDVSEITVAILTIKERGTTLIEKDLSDATVEEDSLSWTLSQEETLSIGAKSASMMLNWKLADGTRGASDAVLVTGGDNHIREVI